MLQSPGTPRKRRAAAAAMQAPPADLVKVEAWEAGSCDGDVSAAAHHKRGRPAQPSPPPNQDMYGNLISEPPPLGLQLRKSASFLDLIQTILSKTKSTVGQPVMENTISSPPMKKVINSSALTPGERLKASNFSGNFLQIGNWEYTPQYEKDLVVKCYYAKRKLVWEVLGYGLKSKIEIQWSHIIDLKATFPEDGSDGTLDLVLSRPPKFFQETDPQPRKHTLWQAAADFTGGRASMYRRHILRCPSDLLRRDFERLIQCDQRLYQLSQQPAIVLDSAVFETRSSIFENPKGSDVSSQKFTHLASPCVVSSVFDNGVKSLMLKQPECFSWPTKLGVAASDVKENYVAQEHKSPNWCNLAVPELRSSMSMEDLLNHIDNYMTEHRGAGDPTLPNSEVASKELLQVAERLLSDTHGTPSADERFLMTQVDSLGCLLEKDTAPATIPISEHNGIIDVAEVGLDGFDGRNAHDAVLPVISRKDSFADLLENLPRLSSIQQFLFDIGEDLDNSSSHS